MKLTSLLTSILSLSLLSSSVLAATTVEYRETISATFTVSAKFNCLETPTIENRVSPFHTGLSVDVGDLLVFDVDPNQVWSAGFNRDSNQNINIVVTTNANGSSGNGNPFGDDYGSITIGSYSFPIGSLVGSLDGGASFFLIGTDLAMFAPKAGRLSFYHWDTTGYDASGSIDVSVSIRK